MSRARPFEHQIAIGRRKQTNIATANVVGHCMSFAKLNAAPAIFEPAMEDDAAYIGKGHEQATEQAISHWEFSASIEKNLSAEFAAWAFAFALGKVVPTHPGTPYIYTCTPLLPSGGVDSPELPYFSFIEAIRQGDFVVLDRMAVGCAIEDLTLAVGTGPGRSSAKLTVNIVGSGKKTEPSVIAIPDDTPEHYLPAPSAALTILGTNYITEKSLVSIEVTYKNNIDLNAGFFPGCNFQTPGNTASGALRGRLEYGNRAVGLRFTARYQNGSPEILALQGLTTGTAVLALTFSADYLLSLTFHKLIYRTARVVNDGETTSITVEGLPLYSSGLLTVVANCMLSDICQAPA